VGVGKGMMGGCPHLVGADHYMCIEDYNEIKAVMIVLINDVILCLFSTPYAGEYGFEISFQQQSKETKSTTWTVSVGVDEIISKNTFLYFLASLIVQMSHNGFCNKLRYYLTDVQCFPGKRPQYKALLSGQI
jgi:hypothetical protein